MSLNQPPPVAAATTPVAKEQCSAVAYLYGKCPKCNEMYDETNLPNRTRCQHSICDHCFAQYEGSKYKCVVCWQSLLLRNDAATSALREPLEKFTKVYEEAEILRSKVKSDAVKIADLEKVIETKSDEIKEMIEANVRSHIGDVGCSECNNIDKEQRVQACETCLTPKFKTFENFVRAVCSSDAKIDSIAICSFCAIKNHMKKGHVVSDFYPTMRKVRFENHTDDLKPILENNHEKTEKLKREMNEMMVFIGEGEEQLNRMTEMIARSKTKKLQTSIANKIEEQVKVNIEHVEKIQAVVADMNAKLRNMTRKLKEENDIVDATHCDEVIFEEPPTKKTCSQTLKK